MIISCPSCQTQFKVDEGRLSPDGKMVRCSKCRHVWRATPDEQPGAQFAAPPTPPQAETIPAAGISAPEAPSVEPSGPETLAPEKPEEGGEPVLSARDPVGGEARGSESAEQGADETKSIKGEEAGADGPASEQRAKLTAARRQQPRSRFWIKVLVIFVVVAGLLLLAQRMMPKPGPKNAGPAVEQPAADGGQAESQPAQ